jgi:hypothetical protein
MGSFGPKVKRVTPSETELIVTPLSPVPVALAYVRLTSFPNWRLEGVSPASAAAGKRGMVSGISTIAGGMPLAEGVKLGVGVPL